MKFEQADFFIVNNQNVDVEIHFNVGLNILTGQNGIGKSTFFNHLKSKTQSVFQGKKVAFMDQFPLSPINDIRLIDILEMMGQRFDSFDKNKAMRLVEYFDIEYLVNRSVKILSGGENQLVKFILAISQNVDFYLLDEPLQYLDKEKLELVINQLCDLGQSSCVFIIEHQSDKLERLNPVQFVMKKQQGRIIINGN